MKIVFYLILYLIPAFIFIYMAGMIYSRNRNSGKHITCSLLFVFTSMWFFGVFTSLVIYPKYFNEIVIYWVNGSITIASLFALHLWLMNANMYHRKNGKFYKLLFLPGILMLLTFPGDSWMIKGDGNPETIFNPGPGIYLLWLLDFSYLAILLFLTVIEMKRGNKAAKLWLKGMLYYFVWTVSMLTASIIFQNTSLYFFYLFIPHGSIFWAVAIFLSMSRFDYLSSYEQRYNILFQRSPVGILIIDEKATVLEASPRIFTYLDVKEQELLHSSLLSVLGGIDRRKFIKEYREAFKKQIKMENLELSFVNKLEERRTLLIDSDFIIIEGKTLQFVMAKDITEAKAKEDDVKHLAYHDILTGLPNRAAFEERIADLLNRSEMFGLLLIDLNKLKQINDTFGHQAGDQAIQYIANIMKEAVKGNHHVARLGGDEFVLLLAIGQTDRTVNEIREGLSFPLNISTDTQFYLSASIGVSYYPTDGETSEELYRIADTRMYEEKNAVD